jgi:hypothetical protein
MHVLSTQHRAPAVVFAPVPQRHRRTRAPPHVAPPGPGDYEVAPREPVPGVPRLGPPPGVKEMRRCVTEPYIRMIVLMTHDRAGSSGRAGRRLRW